MLFGMHTFGILTFANANRDLIYRFGEWSETCNTSSNKYTDSQLGSGNWNMVQDPSGNWVELDKDESIIKRCL